MFQKKFLATFAALFLLLAGLFLLYHSNINETVFLDIAADNPIRVSADEQEEGIAVDENNDGSFTVSLPSTFLYRTKTVYFQNTGNEAVQLRLYSRQKKDGDNVVKFSVDIKKITVNGKSYNAKKQTVWFERPYVVSVPAEKEQGLSLTVQYKTKFMLRNMYLPEFITGIAALLFSITALFICWREKFEAVLICCEKFAEKSFQKNLPKKMQCLINNYEWDTVIIKKYHAIDGVYRKTFWTVFIILNLVFLYYNVHFLWGNHDWSYLIDGMWGKSSLFNGRYTNYLFNQLLGGRLLPIVNVSFALFGFSFTGILLAYYWNVPKTFFNYLVLSLVVVLNPLVIYWCYFGLDVISHLWLPAIVIFALILSEKKSYFYFFSAYLLFVFAFGIYAPAINTIAIVFLGKIIVMYCFEEQSIQLLFKKVIRTFFCIVLSLITVKVIIHFMIVSGVVWADALEYSVSTNLLGGSLDQFIKLVKCSFSHLIDTVPFYDSNVVWLLLIIDIFALLVLFIYQIRYHSLKIFQLFLAVFGVCLLPLAANAVIFILGNDLWLIRVSFYGIIFLFAFFVAVILKSKFVWAKNILIVFLIFLLPMNIYRLYDAQKLWKISFEHDQKVLETLFEKIENSPLYIHDQEYQVIVLGSFESNVLTWYKEKRKWNEFSFMTAPLFEYYPFSYFARYYRSDLNVNKAYKLYKYNGEVFIAHGNVAVDTLLTELVPYFSLLKNMKEWPKNDFVLVQDKYIFINFDNEVLEAILKIMEEKHLGNE